MASWQTRRKKELEEENAQYMIEHILNALSAHPHTPIRCDAKIAKRILLMCPRTWGGKVLNPRAKSLGAGVYQLVIPNNEAE